MKRINNQQKIKNIRKKLRKNMTEEELILWSKLKGKQLEGKKFRRQHSIGNYIVDFYCPENKLAIELDGGQHFEDEQEIYDKIRTKYLNDFGIQVLRFTNLEIRKNLTGILEEIYKTLNSN